MDHSNSVQIGPTACYASAAARARTAFITVITKLDFIGADFTNFTKIIAAEFIATATATATATTVIIIIEGLRHSESSSGSFQTSKADSGTQLKLIDIIKALDVVEARGGPDIQLVVEILQGFGSWALTHCFISIAIAADLRQSRYCLKCLSFYFTYICLSLK